jgi:excinuclease ABC subunit C
MKDVDGKVIYVGKAVNLRNRLRSYFHTSAQEDRKTRKLVNQIIEIEWIVVGSELEALILEMNLIKKYRPHFNAGWSMIRAIPISKLLLGKIGPAYS